MKTQMTSESDLRHIQDAAQPNNDCNFFLCSLLLSGIKAIKVHFTEKYLKAAFIFILICIHTQFYRDIAKGNENPTLPNMTNNL